MTIMPTNTYIDIFMQEVCEPEIQIHPLVEKLNLVEKENDDLKKKLKKIEEEKMKLELYIANVVHDHNIKMDDHNIKIKKIEEEKIAMRLKIRKIRKYAINKEAWYHYVIGSMVTLVAILIAFVVAFKCIRQLYVSFNVCFMRAMYELILINLASSLFMM